jgi:ribosomal protein S12 methylthiotransferase
MNQVDSEKMMSSLVSLGFNITDENDADIIIVNTCGFIESAREESVESILSVARMKKNGRLKALIVAGCLAERYGDEIRKEFPEADAVIGLKDAEKIPQVCMELLGVESPEKREGSKVLIGLPHTAYLKISEGCNNRCSYCAIPLIRGPFRSFDEDAIISEARELISFDIREIVLIGQDTTLYGGAPDGGKLAGLIRKLADIDGIEWIRLMYAHPAHFGDELVKAYADIPKLVPYLDMPIQHISENILKSMGRSTSPDEIRKLIDKLRGSVKDLVLRTSLMVGFPGETDKNFKELIDFVTDVRFERMGAFIYSPEEGTKAASLDDIIPEDKASKRYDFLMRIQQEISAEFQKSLIGREFDMILDESEPFGKVVTGRAYFDAPEIDGNILASGKVKDNNAFQKVKITGAKEYDLKGLFI